jgi:hypothetical protein
MVWAVGVGGALGLLLGLRFRMPALLAASGISACVFLAIAPYAGLTLMAGVIGFLALMGALQAGYLTGVTLMTGCSRTRTKPSRQSAPTNDRV